MWVAMGLRVSTVCVAPLPPPPQGCLIVIRGFAVAVVVCVDFAGMRSSSIRGVHRFVPSHRCYLILFTGVEGKVDALGTGVLLQTLLWAATFALCCVKYGCGGCLSVVVHVET